MTYAVAAALMGFRPRVFEQLLFIMASIEGPVKESE